jgi:hypothetical protein
MRVIYLTTGIILLCTLIGCNSKKNDTGQSQILKSDSFQKIDTVLPSDKHELNYLGIPTFDSISANYFPDNNNLKRIRQLVLKDFTVNIAPFGQYDTLVDLNYDNYRDYIIGYYGAAGTGIKFRIAVYLYSKKTNNYLFNKELSSLVNPSFFIHEKKITGFYIGLGGGYGKKLEWINKRWILTKEFSVQDNGDSTVWELNYPIANKQEKIIRSFQGIPPQEILETNRKF